VILNLRPPEAQVLPNSERYLRTINRANKGYLILETDLASIHFLTHLTRKMAGLHSKIKFQELDLANNDFVVSVPAENHLVRILINEIVHMALVDKTRLCHNLIAEEYLRRHSSGLSDIALLARSTSWHTSAPKNALEYGTAKVKGSTSKLQSVFDQCVSKTKANDACRCTEQHGVSLLQPPQPISNKNETTSVHTYIFTRIVMHVFIGLMHRLGGDMIGPNNSIGKILLTKND
jgi:hypothetical protein